MNKKRKKTQKQDGNIKRQDRKNRMVKWESKKKKEKRKKRSLFVHLFVSIIRNKEKSDETRGRTEKTGLEIKNKMNRQKNKIK